MTHSLDIAACESRLASSMKVSKVPHHGVLPLPSPLPSTSAVRFRKSGRVGAARTVIQATAAPSTEIVFQPFTEVKGQLTAVSKTDNSTHSFARLDYHEECEAGINEQINIEYNISYVYHALHAFFDRDNIGLPGMAQYFKEASEEEREHAQMLITFQNIRGGRVKLGGIVAPEMEYNHPDKGDALYAMELALSLEKLNFCKLRLLHDIACKHDDAQMADFIEGSLLQEQAKAVKEASVYVSMLRRVGKGHGTWHFDRYLREGTPVPEVA